jgi:hypothetical protein
MKVKSMEMIMDGALIKGENKVMELKTKVHKLKTMMMDLFNVNLRHLTQEYIKWFKEIIPWTTFLEASKEG